MRIQENSIEQNLEPLSYQEQLKQLLQMEGEFKSTFNTTQDSVYYMMSASWYDNFKNNEQQKYLPFNSDLFNENEQLKQDLEADKDYYVFSQQMMDLIKNHHQGQEISVGSFMVDGQKQIDVSSLNICFVNNEYLKWIDINRVQSLQIKTLVLSPKITYKEFRQKCVEELKYPCIMQNQYSNMNQVDLDNFKMENLRFWKVSGDLEGFFSMLKQKCTDSQTYEYRLEIDKDLIEQQLDQNLGECDFGDLVVIDIRTDFKQWQLVKKGEQQMESCEGCKKYVDLPFQCNCKKVSYCSQICMNRDYNYHADRCDYIESDNDEDFQFQAESKQGLVGLYNLGNSCYMNAALQCLSHTKTLSQYMLEKKYIQEINLNNILGYGGKIAKSYASLMKNLWIGEKEIFTPKLFKKLISSLNPMFAGYQQHDSSELLSYILDGLHEDLNRVINKPYTEAIEYNDRPDQVVADESWQNHIMRNQSIIVDLMHGQFKSRIECSQCNQISNCFDPFMMCTLPLPQSNIEKIGFYFLSYDNRTKAYKINLKFQAGENQTVLELKKQLSELMGVKQDDFFFAFLTYKDVDFIVQDSQLITEVQQLEKSKNLFALQITEEDKLIQDKVMIPVKISKSKYEQQRQESTFARPFFWDRNSTLEQIHMRLFSYQKFIFEEFYPNPEQIKNMDDQQAYQHLFQNGQQHYRILITYKQNDNFYFGETKQDTFQELAFSGQETLNDILAKIPEEKLLGLKFAFEINWNHNYFNYDLSRFNSCMDFHKKQDFRQSKEKSIYDCLELFRSNNTLDQGNELYCSKCKQHVEAQKKMEIYKAPQILIFHLKRFRVHHNHAEKSNMKINFPIEGLDLTNYVLNHQQPKTQIYNMEIETIDDQDKIIYDLYAVTNHYGQMGYGHYTAYCLNENSSKWLLFDDSTVTEEPNPQKVITEAAYLLFYKRRS